jgi:hypothetical protein
MKLKYLKKVKVVLLNSMSKEEGAEFFNALVPGN